MTEQGWLVVLSILTTIACSLLAAMLAALALWKKNINRQIREWKESLEGQIQKYCTQNEKDHEDLWIRINHHFHNGGGNVVIPTTAPRK